jgi:ribonuclease-3
MGSVMPEPGARPPTDSFKGSEPGEVAALADRLGNRFRDPNLLLRALTHPSYAHEHPPALHNETLALLGDAVLGLVVAEWLVARAPADGVGALTQRRAALVAARSLAEWAVALGLPAALRLGRGETEGGGGRKESILATAFEAVLAAVYLEAGLEAARGLVVPFLDRAATTSRARRSVHPGGEAPPAAPSQTFPPGPASAP